MYYEKIFRIFQKKKVAYLIAGGMAVNLYGVPRFTKDLDILINPDKANLKQLQAALQELGYRPKIPVTIKQFLNPENWKIWNKEKGMIAFNLYNPKIPYEEIDILIHSPISYQQAQKRKFSLRVGSLRLFLVSINDLIKMKQSAGRGQDLSDIQALRKVKKMRSAL